MPLLKLSLSAKLEDEKKEKLLKSLSKIVAESIGKPESYVMISIDNAAMLMAGQTGPTAFADVRSIGGLDGDTNKKLSAKICALLKEQCGIPPNRVYLNFTDIDASSWGWNNGTFG